VESFSIEILVNPEELPHSRMDWLSASLEVTFMYVQFRFVVVLSGIVGASKSTDVKETVDADMIINAASKIMPTSASRLDILTKSPYSRYHPICFFSYIYDVMRARLFAFISNFTNNIMSDYKLTYRLDLGPLATFSPNKRIPVYNWYYYKEAYSRDMVFFLIEHFGLKAGNIVLDPFCGTGTTLLACRDKGIDAIGSDVSDVAVLASKVKARRYDIEKLREEARNIFKEKFVAPQAKIDSGVVMRSFSKYALESIIFFRDKISKVEDETARDFLMLALMVSAMEISSVKKTGRSLCAQKNTSAPPLKFLLKRRLKNMLRDLKKAGGSKSKLEVMHSSATSLDIKSASIDVIITSPPYLAKMEYTQIYSIEQVLFFGKTGRPQVESAIGEKESSDVFGGKYDLPEESFGYFNDMNLAICEMHRVLKTGGNAAIIVGEGCFPDRVVPSDTLLAELAERAGFVVREIVVLNERWCMRDRTEKVAKLRESMIFLEKP